MAAPYDVEEPLVTAFTPQCDHDEAVHITDPCLQDPATSENDGDFRNTLVACG